MRKYKLLLILSSVSLVGLINVGCQSGGNNSYQDVIEGSNPVAANRVKVIFDFNGGHLKKDPAVFSKTYNVRKGLTYGYVKDYTPKGTDIECDKRKFKFWSVDGTTEINDTYTFDNDTTIKAIYDYDDIAVTFNGNNGNVKKDGTVITSDTITYGTKWGDIKSHYTAEYTKASEVKMTFSHFTIGDTTEKMYDSYVFTTPVTLKANYAVEKVIVTIDPNGGAFDTDGKETRSKAAQVDYHKDWQDIAGSYKINKAPDGYTFNTYERYDETNKKWIEIGDSAYYLDFNQTIRAKYSPTKFSITAKCSEGGKYTAGTTPKTISNVEYNSDFDTIKDQLSVTPDDGYIFTNYTNKAGDIVGSGYKFTNSTDEEITANFVSKGATVTLTIDPGKGSIDSKVVSVTKDAKWSSISTKHTPIAPTGYKFKEYTYVNSSGVATSVTDDYQFSADVTFTASYEIDQPATHDFSTDSWTTVSYYANQGLDKVKEIYGANFDQKTRTVSIDNVDYSVRVIGKEEDRINASNRATLTFEFVNVLPFYISYSTYGDNNNTYSTSNLRNYLNNALFEKLPSDVKDNVVGVKKYTYDYADEGKGTIKESDEKLFALSVKEMGYSQYHDANPQTVKNEGLNASTTELHDQSYSYYKTRAVGATDLGKTAKDAKGVESSQNVSYWTRSPDIKTSGHAWTISGAYTDSSSTSHEGGMLGEYDGSDTYFNPIDVKFAPGVSPAFCIGKASHSVKFTGTNYKIAGIQPCYYDKTTFISGDTVSIPNIKANSSYTLTDAEVTVKWNGVTKTKDTDYTFTIDASGEATFALKNAAEAYDIEITIVPKGV